MSKSKEFNNAFDMCLERLLARGESLEQCLQDFPEHADELKPLLETALSVKQMSAIQPRPEVKERVRHHLNSVLRSMEAKKSMRFLSWQPRWAVAIAILLVFLLASSTTVAAAGNSMPDEPLYPVKLATEQVRLVFTPSALGKIELFAELADRRVEEIVSMVDESKAEQIERTARRLDRYMTKIADLSGTSQRGEPAALMAPAVAEAPVPAPAVPPEVIVIVPEPAPSIVLVSPEQFERYKGKEKDERDDRRAKLRETMLRHAAEHPERLRALLSQVPPSARPALIRAIAASESGYRQALESLDD